MNQRDAWNPEQYERFRDERSQPFFDLMAMVDARPGMRIIDLGCGTGELTRVLHEGFRAQHTRGTDSSPAMLAKCATHGAPEVEFARQDINEFCDKEQWDLVFSNAALHWVEDHERLFGRLVQALRPGGQIAVQMPANHDHPAYVAADALAQTAEFAPELKGFVRRSPVQVPEWYAALLFRLGLKDRQVRLNVYGHELESRDAVLEWIKGSYLTDYEKRMSPEAYAMYLAALRIRLREVQSDERPCLFTFKRVFLCASRH